jgi:hypothetical protein
MPKQSSSMKKLNKKDIQIFGEGTLLNSAKKNIKVNRISVTKPNGMTSY